MSPFAPSPTPLSPTSAPPPPTSPTTNSTPGRPDKRRVQKPLKPHLSLHDLFFAVDVQTSRESVVTVVKPGGELKLDKNGVFRFDIEVESEKLVGFEALDSLRITWNVVLEGFKGVFTMMDCKGKGSFVLGLEGGSRRSCRRRGAARATPRVGWWRI
ncbi:UNVERIFIED_CONTAM: hypothetical protein Slati_3025200 [Sesamum latifolium]|uniref:Uncharacterized protein n=1 Tax=Sesamum latifolium TaxID=2727402 RepID=A0AAW2VHU9_9LAMI